METHKLYDEQLQNLIREAASHELNNDETTTVMKNLKIFSECRPPVPEPEPVLPPVPTTRLGKAKAQVACALDNETTRTGLKVLGPIVVAGMWIAATVKRDHVIAREANQQINQFKY